MPTNKAFDNWLSQVSDEVQDMIFLSLDDLPDLDFASMFEDDTPPAEAALFVLENAGYTYTQEFDEFTDADPGL